jgi:putative nucleotidyltransferase with HDIG domain
MLSHLQVRGPERSTRRLRAAGDSLQMIEALARTINARDAATYEHAERVRGYAMALADAVSTCDAHTTDALDHAALLHDVGKLALPDWLLQKPGPLTRHEYEQVKQHVTIGADMLAALAYPGPLALIVRHHHEHWDGGGYPDGLSGDAIPLGARILAITDFYDALTCDRPYRHAIAHGPAIDMLRARAGQAYDPELVDLFVPLIDRLRATERKVLTPRFPALVRAGWLTEARAAV